MKSVAGFRVIVKNVVKVVLVRPIFFYAFLRALAAATECCDARLHAPTARLK